MYAVQRSRSKRFIKDNDVVFMTLAKRMSCLTYSFVICRVFQSRFIKMIMFCARNLDLHFKVSVKTYR